MKYIIIDGVKPIVFSEAQLHSEFKNMGEITSAGKCSIRNNKVSCFGESISLKLKPNERDAKIIKMNLLEILFEEDGE